LIHIFLMPIRYTNSVSSVKSELKVKWEARSLSYAKNIIRLQKNVKTRSLKNGEVVYKEGDKGKSMFLVDETDGGRLDVMHGNYQVHSYQNGDSFGESSLLFTKPRSSTVICASPVCKLHEMRGSDFLKVIESAPKFDSSLRDMCRKRLFKKAVKSFSKDQHGGFSSDEILATFHLLDKSGLDGDGLSLDDFRRIMRRIDPNLPESEIKATFKFMDVDEDGNFSLEEFLRIFRCFEKKAIA